MIAKAIHFTKFSDAIIPIVYSLTLFTIMFLACCLLCYKWTAKGLMIGLTITNAACVYFMKTYSVTIDEEMVRNVFATDVKEATDLLSLSFVLHILFLGIVPSLFLFRLKVKYNNFFKEAFLRILICVILLVVSLAAIGLNYRKVATFTRTNNYAFHYLVPRNYVNACFRIVKKHFKTEQKVQAIGNDIVLTEDHNQLVILIVGETARKANFSLYGYERETNPLLKKDGVEVIMNATSCGTSTKVSVPCMFSHLTRQEFINSKQKFEFLPSTLKRHGVNVLYKDNNFGGCQRTCEGVETINTTNLKDKKHCASGECVDGILLEGLEEWIKLHKDNAFVVLHQNGSHGPKYNKRYPKEFEKFKPVCEDSDVSNCSQNSLINGYDNTILYTDFIVHGAIEIAKKSKRPAIVVYVSDHGESLGENSMYLHGFLYDMAPKEQKEVPLIVWKNEQFKKLHPVKDKNENYENFSHDNIFHTVLGIFFVKTELYRNELDLHD